MNIEDAYSEIAPKLMSYLTGNGSSYATACDIVQETFLRLWKRRDELSDDLAQVSGLAFTVARNFRNDLARRAKRETLQGDFSNDGEGGELVPAELVADAPTASSFDADSGSALRRRLKAAFARMPTQLLEAFMLSRLGDLSGKEIASHMNMSESNVKVRVHRAKEMFRQIFVEGKDARPSAGEGKPPGMGFAVLKTAMMLSAVDGQVAKAELELFRELAAPFRAEAGDGFDDMWQAAVRSASYLGFLSGELSREEMADEFVQEAGADFVADLGRASEEERLRVFAAFKRMALADGECSAVERMCILALLERSRDAR